LVIRKIEIRNKVEKIDDNVRYYHTSIRLPILIETKGSQISDFGTEKKESQMLTQTGIIEVVGMTCIHAFLDRHSRAVERQNFVSPLLFPHKSITMRIGETMTPCHCDIVSL
jgi:hypothetical protein